jgi:hypothetical protein
METVYRRCADPLEKHFRRILWTTMNRLYPPRDARDSGPIGNDASGL